MLFHFARIVACAAVGGLHGWVCYRIDDCTATKSLIVLGVSIGALIGLLAALYTTSVWRIAIGTLRAIGTVIAQYNASGTDVVDSALVARPRTEISTWLFRDFETVNFRVGTVFYVMGALGAVLGLVFSVYVPVVMTDESAFETILAFVARWALVPSIGAMVGCIYAFVVLGVLWCWASRLNIVLGGLVGAYFAVAIVWSMEGEKSAVPIWSLYLFFVVAQSTVGMVAGAVAALVQFAMYAKERNVSPQIGAD